MDNEKVVKTWKKRKRIPWEKRKRGRVRQGVYIVTSLFMVFQTISPAFAAQELKSNETIIRNQSPLENLTFTTQNTSEKEHIQTELPIDIESDDLPMGETIEQKNNEDGVSGSEPSKETEGKEVDSELAEPPSPRSEQEQPIEPEPESEPEDSRTINQEKSDEESSPSIEPVDNQAPTWEDPTIEVTEQTTTRLVLNWSPASENTSWYIVSVTQGGREVDDRYVEEGTSATFDRLAPGETYGFSVRACNSSEECSTGPMKTVSMTEDHTPPTWPQGAELVASEIGATTASLNWPAGQDDSAIAQYQIYNNDDELIAETEGNETTLQLTELQPGVPHNLSVEAIDGSDNKSTERLTVTFTTEQDSPPDWGENPTVTVVSKGSSFIELQWSEASDNSENLANYIIHYGTDEVMVDGHLQTHKINGLSPETNYPFKIEARDGAGNVTTNGPSISETTEPFSTIENLTWSGTESEITLTWDGAPEANEYTIMRDGNKTDTTTFPTFEDTGLTRGTTYEYQVMAIDQYGNESQPAVVEASTTKGVSIIRVSVDEQGEGLGDDYSRAPSYSSNGRYIAFDYDRSVYVHDLETGGLELVSTHPADYYGTNSVGTNPSINADGRYVAYQSAYNDSFPNIFIWDRKLQVPIHLTEGDGYQDKHFNPSISEDGRFVTFQSNTTTLADSPDNEVEDIYLYDRDPDENGEFDEESTSLIRVTTSVNDDQLDGDSINARMSGNGEYIVFESEASNLVEDDTNEESDIFRYHIETSTLERVSVAANGGNPDGQSDMPSVSDDGQLIAFRSGATNLINQSLPNSKMQVYARNMETGVSELVSMDENGSIPTDGSEEPSVSADGRYVAFVSGSYYDRNLLVRDRQTNSSRKIVVIDGYNLLPDIRGDGLGLVFVSNNSNLVENDEVGTRDIFVARYGNEMETEKPIWNSPTLDASNVGPAQLTLNWSGAEDDSAIQYYWVYQDDTYIGSTNTEEFVVDQLTAQTSYTFRVEAIDRYGNRSNSGPTIDVTTPELMEVPENITYKPYDYGIFLEWDHPKNALESDMRRYHISRDGEDLGARVTANFLDHDLEPETTYEYEVHGEDDYGHLSKVASITATTRTAGQGLTTTRLSLMDSGEEAQKPSLNPDVSNDGRYVVFDTRAPLIAGDDNVKDDVYLRDRQTNELKLVSLTEDGSLGNGDSEHASISGDGRYIIFESKASNLVSDDENGTRTDVYYVDTQATTDEQRIKRVNVSSDGSQPDEDSFATAINEDGRYVLFTTKSELAPGLDPEYANTENLYLYDVQTENTMLIADGSDVTYDNAEIVAAELSADGRYIAYNIEFEYLNRTENEVFIYDRDTDEDNIFDESDATEVIEIPRRQYGDGVDISDDGRFVVYGTTLYDIETGEEEEVAKDPTGREEGGWGSSISGNGRYVLFITNDEIVPGDNNDKSDVFRYDRELGWIERLSVSSEGIEADENSYHAAINQDGSVSIIESPASTLVENDTNSKHDIVAVEWDQTMPEWSENSEITISNVSQTLVSLNWTQVTGDVKTYRLYKDNELLDTVPANQIQYDVSNLEAGTEYVFRIEAGDESGNWTTTGPSIEVTTLSEDSTIGDAPLLATVKEGGKVELAWDPINDSQGYTGYQVLRWQEGQSPEVVGTIDDLTTVTFIDAGLAANTTYFYKINLISGGKGATTYTQEVSVDTEGLAIGELSWSIDRTTFPYRFAQRDGTLNVTLTAETNRRAEALFTYLVWNEDYSVAEEKQIKIPLTESVEQEGEYEGSFKLEPDTAELVSLQPVLLDATGNSQQGDVQSINLEVAGELSLEVNTEGSGSVLNETTLIVWSEQLGTGVNLKMDGKNQFDLTNLPSATDYSIRILHQETGRVLAEQQAFEIKAGMINTNSILSKVPSSLKLKIVDLEGSNLRDIQVFAHDVDGNLIGSDESPDNQGLLSPIKGANLFSGDQVTLTFNGIEWPYNENMEQTLELKPGEYREDVVIPWWSSAFIEGSAVDHEGNPMSGVEVTATQDHPTNDWRKINNRVTTDENGEYRIEVFPGKAKLSATDPNNKQWGFSEIDVEVAEDETLSQILELKKLQEATVSLNIRTKYLDDTNWQVLEADEVSWRVLAHYDNVRVEAPNGRISHGSTYPIRVWGIPGDEITVCLSGEREADLGEDCSSGTLDENWETTIDLELEQTGGYFEGNVLDAETNEPVKNFSARLYKLTDSGSRKYVKRYSHREDDNQMRLWVPDTGDHILEVKQGSRMAQVEFNMEQNEIESQNIVLSQAGKFSGRDGNSVVGMQSEVMADTEAGFRISYRNDSNERVTDSSIKIPIPDGTNLVESTLTLDGNVVSDEQFSLSGNILEVVLGELAKDDAGTVRFELKVESGFDQDAVGVSATMNYMAGGEQTEEFLGSAQIAVPMVTINAPSILTDIEEEIHLNGRAPAGSTVRVYDGQVLLGEVTASPVGFWLMDTTLSNQNQAVYHNVKASVDSNPSLDAFDETTVLFNPNIPRLERVTLEQPEGRKLAFETSSSIPRFPYVVVPRRPFTFTLEFNNPQAVKNVKVRIGTEEEEGDVGTATLGEDGLYHATVTPRYWPEGEIYVDYDIADDLIPEDLSREEIIEELPPSLREQVAEPFMQQLTREEFENSGELESQKEISVGGLPTTIEKRNDSVEIEDTDQPVTSVEIDGQTIPIYGYGHHFFEGDGQVGVQLYVTVPEEFDDRVSAENGEMKVYSAAKMKLVKKVWNAYQNGSDINDIIDALDMTDHTDTYKWAGRVFAGIRSDINKICDPWLRSRVYRIVDNTWYDDVMRPEIVRYAMMLEPYVLGDFYDGVMEDVQEKSTRWARNYVDGILSRQDCEPAGNPEFIHDPSGYVYEVLESNRIDGVKATAMFRDNEEEDWQVWDAEWYGQENPHYTDPRGRYGWDVPPGQWKVVYEKEGYETISSDVFYGALDVPPPRFHVNVPMKSIEAPEIVEVKAVEGEGISVTFDKHIETSTVTESTYQLESEGERLTGTVSFEDDVHYSEDSNVGTEVAKTVVFTPEQPFTVGTTVELDIRNLIQSYAGIPMAANYTKTVTVEAKEDEGNGDQDPGEGDGDQDPGEGEGDQDPGEGDGDQDPGEGEGDQDPGEGEGDQDPGEGEGDQDPGEGEGDPDPGEGEGDQDPGEGEGDPDSGEEDGDQDPGEGEGDQDPGEGNGDQDPGEGDQEPGEEEGDQEPGEGEGDQDPGEEEGDQDPGEGEGDQEPGEEEGDEDSGEEEGDEDSGEGEGDQDPGEGDPDSDNGDGSDNNGSGNGKGDNDGNSRQGKKFDPTKRSTVSFEDEGVTLHIPADSVNEDMEEVRVEVKGLDANKQKERKPSNNYHDVGIYLDIKLTAYSNRKDQKGEAVEGKLGHPMILEIDLDNESLTGVNSEKVGLYGYDETTEEWIYLHGKYDPQTQQISVLVDEFKTIAVFVSKKTFTDIQDHWAQEMIEIIAGRQIIKGRSQKSFAPNHQITRAEFTALLVRTLTVNEENNQTNIFDDVSQSDWYVGAITQAYEAGLIEGVSAKRFNPMSPVTREQLVVIIARALQQQGFDTDLADQQVNKILAGYKDSETVANWAKMSIAYAIQNGIIKGRTNEELKPQGTATRAEAAVIMKRFIDLWQN